MQDKIIKNIAPILMSVGFSLVLFYFFWKEDQGGWIPRIGAIMISLGWILGLFSKSLRKGNKKNSNEK
jgi:hypothetical protein